MKKAIVLATLVAATGAIAQTPNSELSFGDLNYFFKAQQFNVRADFLLDRTETHIDSQSSKLTTEGEGYLIDTQYNYGLMDNLNLSLGLTYQLNYRFNTEPVAANQRYNEDGLRNPALGLNYRFLNQKENGVNWDFGVVGRFALMDAERGNYGGSTSADGNAASGHHSIEASTSLGLKWNEANEFRLVGGVIHHFDGEYTSNSTDATSDVDYDTAAYQDVFFKAAYQYRPVYEFMMSFGTTITMYGEREDEQTNQALNDTLTYDSHVDGSFEYTAKYYFHEKAILRFNYIQGILKDIAVDRRLAADQTFNRRRSQTFGFGLDLLF
jgi:hypothetical protein